jgi:hypothetical protein
MQYVNIHCLIIIHLFDRKWVFGEPRCCGCGRAVVAEEEAAVEAAAEETGSSGVYGGGGDRQSRERRSRERWRGDRRGEFWNESQTTQGGLLFIGSKISAAVLN